MAKLLACRYIRKMYFNHRQAALHSIGHGISYRKRVMGVCTRIQHHANSSRVGYRLLQRINDGTLAVVLKIDDIQTYELPLKRRNKGIETFGAIHSGRALTDAVQVRPVDYDYLVFHRSTNLQNSFYFNREFVIFAQKNNMRFNFTYTIICLTVALAACSSGKKSSVESEENVTEQATAPVFDADSAFAFVKAQTDFGPRVPNTQAHRLTGKWLEQELKRHGAAVIVQPMQLKAFDGTMLQARNIMGQYNPQEGDRLLLMAHWDTRPWADNDPDKANHTKAPDGANDGASGVGVLLEVARALAADNPERGIDILFLDAEDWGSHTDNASWALGAEYFVNNPIVPGYRPAQAILVDMVGGRGSLFYREGQSQYNTPALNDAVWAIASSAGLGNIFINQVGGIVTDDHVKFLQVGIPAIDIIAYDPTSGTGFPPTWHTMEDNLKNIDPQVLGAVGQVLLNYIYAK